MANTYVAIATVTVGSGGAANIEFTSIPQTYTDLSVVLSARTNRNSYQDYIKLTFNSSTTNVTNRTLINDNGTVSSEAPTGMRFGRASASSATASTFGSCSLYIPNYTSSNNKSSSADGTSELNGTQVGQALDANLWSNTAAITSIQIAPGDGTLFVQYSTATLYGIKNS
jgi:hypothetical protein